MNSHKHAEHGGDDDSHDISTGSSRGGSELVDRNRNGKCAYKLHPALFFTEIGSTIRRFQRTWSGSFQHVWIHPSLRQAPDPQECFGRSEDTAYVASLGSVTMEVAG